MNNENPDRLRPMDSNILTRVRGVAKRLIQYALDWIDEKSYVDRHRRYLAEIEMNGDLGAFLECYDLTHEQLEAFAISPLASAELLARMIEHIGLADGQIPSARGNLVEQCRLCGNWRQCRRWLDRGEQNEEYRNFCANADLFDRLRVEVCGRPSSKAS